MCREGRSSCWGSPRGRRAPALKGALGRKVGLEARAAWGRGRPSGRRRRGCSLAGTMCGKRRPPGGAAGEQGLRRARRKPGSRVTHEGREPAAGLTEAAGETVHLAGNAPGSGLSGADASFSTLTEWRPRSLTRSSSASPDAAPDSRLRRPPVSPSARGVGGSVSQVESRTTRRLPGLSTLSLPSRSSERRAPPPRPRAATAPPPRTPSRFRSRPPRDGSGRGFLWHAPFLAGPLQPARFLEQRG